MAVVRLLRQQGAEVLDKGNEGETPVHRHPCRLIRKVGMTTHDVIPIILFPCIATPARTPSRTSPLSSARVKLCPSEVVKGRR